MSEKGKGSTKAAAAAKGHKTSGIVSKFKQLAKLCGEIEEEEEELKSFDDLLNEVGRLKGEIARKDKELNTKGDEVRHRDAAIAERHAENDRLSKQHEAEKDLLMDNFEKRARKRADDQTRIETQEETITRLAERANNAEGEVTRLKQQLNESMTNYKKAQGSLQSAEETNKKLHKDFKSTNSTLKITRQSLEDAEAKLDELTAEINIIDPDQDRLKDDLAAFAANCHTLVKKYFYSDELASPALTFDLDSSQSLDMSDIISPMLLDLVGFDQSRCLHMAMAEAVICQALCSRIFKPYYVLDSTDTDKLLRSTARENPRREALLRCQLAAAIPEEQACDLAADAATDLAKSLATDQSRRAQEFCTELVEIFRHGAAIWRRAQSSEVRIVARTLRRAKGGGFDLDETWTDETDKYPDYDDLVPLKKEQEQYRTTYAEPMATLFPKIKQGETILYHGAALWQNQNAAVVANITYHGWDRPLSSHSELSKLTNGSRRRLSSATAGYPRSNGANSEHGPSKPLSFSNRVQSSAQSLNAPLRPSKHARVPTSPKSPGE